MSKPSKNFILCVHAHQPIGNFDWVFAEAYEKSYKPFFEVMDRHPRIPFCAHFSGCLIDWLMIHKPDFVELLKKMAGRGQIEFIGGAYYEPIYGLIPEGDLKGQIELMQEKIKTLFGQTPQGVWLTERVWDSKLIKPLNEAGVKFTILDDLHFEKVGLDAPVTGYYTTKKGKDSLDLFASMKNLRYLMPFRKAEETFEFIHELPASAQDALVFADDCEKFGMWPGTYDWVYKEGWLERFLTLLETDSAVTACTFGTFRKNFKPKGIVEIPHASYSEMMEWSGGWFYNFLKRYSEIRFMYERMCNVSRRLAKLSAKNTGLKATREARIALYKAQCNCSYWHGVFGGLYLHHLRSAVFENLIQAEYWIAQALKASKKASAAIFSEKFESGERIRVNQKEIASIINPSYGASLEELDYLPKSVNLTCNLKRQKEVYHEAVLKKSSDPQPASGHLSIHEILGVKEEGLEKRLQYDLFRKLSFLDHFFEEPIDREAFALCAYKDAGDFSDKAFKTSIRKKSSSGSVAFLRKGNLVLGGKKHPFSVEKVYQPKGANSIAVKYTFKNISARPISVSWGAEFNFSIGDKQAMAGLDVPNCKDWIFNDSWRGVQIELRGKHDFHLFAAPIETISESESGLGRTFQELGVLLQRRLSLKPKESVQYVLELAVKS